MRYPYRLFLPANVVVCIVSLMYFSHNSYGTDIFYDEHFVKKMLCFFVYLKKNVVMQKIIIFDTTDKLKWLSIIANVHKTIHFAEKKDSVAFNFDSIIDSRKITPIHIVSLACLFEYLDRLKYTIHIQNIKDSPISRYLWENVRIREYWAGKQNYVQAQDSDIFNLWRIVDAEKEVHSRRVHDFLKQRFFSNKDLSAVQNSLDEVYYNIFDHANADGNAFSFIRFDRNSEKLDVAVCDFGIGIAQSVKNMLPQIKHDSSALRKALEYNFTTKSKTHNMGMGLGNIKDACTDEDFFGIISNEGYLIASQDKIRANKIKFNFPGTLIYYQLSLSHFDDEEIIDSFVL